MTSIEIQKQRANERSKRHYWKHRERHLAYNHWYYRQNIEKEKQRHHIYNETHKETRRLYRIKYRQTHRDELCMIHERWQFKLKTEVLIHYGNGKCACVKCGESRLACLSLDHIEGGGNKEMKRTGLGGIRRYLKLRQTGFPAGHQTMCMNCQFIKRVENNECGRIRGQR